MLFCLEEPTNDTCTWLFAAWANFVYCHAKYSYNGRNPYLVELQFVEIDKRLGRKAALLGGGQIAARVVDWDGYTMTLIPQSEDKPGELRCQKGPKRNILIKIYDGFFQAGDKIIENFDESDPKSIENLRKVLEAEYWGKETLIMDLLDPDAEIKRNGFDIRTILCPDGSIQLFHSNFLGGCSDYYSWSANFNSTIDFHTEEIVSSQFYDGNTPKKTFKDNPWIGKKLEGVSELAETLCRAHKHLLKDLPRYTSCGWDCMKTDQGYVIFEANLCTARSDSFYFSFAQAWYFLRNFSWPFDESRIACLSPGNEFFLPKIPDNDAFMGRYVFEMDGISSANEIYGDNTEENKSLMKKARLHGEGQREKDKKE